MLSYALRRITDAACLIFGFAARMLSNAHGKPSFARTSAFYLILMSMESVIFAQGVLIYAIKTDHWTEAKDFMQAASVPATTIFSVQLLAALVPYVASKIIDRKAGRTDAQ